MAGDPSTCAELIDDAKQYETESGLCGLSEIHKLYCCPSEPENPCTICPNGVTHPEGDVHVPNGRTMTCGELIHSDTLFETESSYCRVFGKMNESDCCPPDETPAP